MPALVKLPLPEFARFGREIGGDLAQAERREWWLANGLGGHAAGTIAGRLTRRYHGVLITPVNPPPGRHLVFAKAEAVLHDGEREWGLGTNHWANGAVAPRGHVHIESFHLEGRMPVWQYAVDALRLEQRMGTRQQLSPGTAMGMAAGPLRTGALPVNGNAAAAQQLLEPVQNHLRDAGLGTISEIFDGDPPHTPRGAPAQAWSVACVLEAWWRLDQARRAGATAEMADNATINSDDNRQTSGGR
jgi:glycogen debranching enzyme